MITVFTIKNTNYPITIDFSYTTRAGTPARVIINIDVITRAKPGCKTKLEYGNTYRDFYVIEGMIKRATGLITAYYGPYNRAIYVTPDVAITTIYSYLRTNCDTIYNRCVKNRDHEYSRVVNSLGL